MDDKKVVLIVDDTPENLRLLGDMLEQEGYEVLVATNGPDALENARGTPAPDLILLDIMMPDMDGYEVCRRLKADPDLKGIFAGASLTIIGISASAFETEKQHFLAAGVNAFITKPFREQELFDVLARHAGVQFATEEDERALDIKPSHDIPTLENMSAPWREAFREALARRNITRIRKLAEEAGEVDPPLAVWLLERVAGHELQELKKLNDGNE